MSFLLIYITHPDHKTAKRISERLISEKYVACSNIFPIESSYWWKGEIENEDEFVSIVKTRCSHFEIIERKVKELHPYDIPCIMALEVQANEDYEKWIIESTADNIK